MTQRKDMGRGWAIWCAAFLASTPLLAVTPTLVTMPPGPYGQAECTYMDDSGCENKPIFSSASFDWSGNRWMYASTQGASILVNRQNISTGAWAWTPTSKVAIDFTNFRGAPPTIAVGSVFRQATAAYLNVANGLRYNLVMYLVYQGTATPNEAGSVCLSFSNDGETWTVPIWAVYQHMTWVPRGARCGSNGGGVVNAEAISGFHSDSTNIHLFHMEGDLALIESLASTTNSLTWYSTTNINQPDVLNRQNQITSVGVSAKNYPGGVVNRFFVNLDATYDPANGRTYLVRTYAAPYSPTDLTMPCQQAGPNGIATLPMRAQIYEMLTNLTFTKVLITQPFSWTLTGELGDHRGHHIDVGGGCVPYVLDTCMSSNNYVGGDLDSMSVHKTPLGQLYRNASGQALVFASLWYRANGVGIWRETSLQNQFNSGGPVGGSWRDAGYYQFFWPPTGNPTNICI